MKSRIGYIVMLLVAVTSLPARGQVAQLGKAPLSGGVRKASCSTCDSGQVVSGFYDGAVWGTSCGGCSSCDIRPGLFPPCPNPCNTTLLGDVVCDVKCAVDNGLSHLVGSLFGALCLPCGCRDVCSCETLCDSGCSGGCDSGCSSMGAVGSGCSSCNSGVVSSPVYSPAPAMSPTPATPLQPTPVGVPTQANPFVDDPAPSARLQPVPPRAARHIKAAPRMSKAPARRTIQAVNFESPAEDASIDNTPAQIEAPESQPLTHQSGHYLPRRTTSLRQSNGKELKLAPMRATGEAPALRFRDAN